MKMKSKLKPVATALGTTFVISLATSPAVSAAENPFSMNVLSNGYMVAEGDAEGKCGASKEESEGKCGDQKDTSAEGKCGEGKCGEKRKAHEGKCGEGKCGDTSKQESS